MSFILNALRKSEQERQAGQAEPLENKFIEKQPVVVKKNNSKWLVILALFNIFFLVFIIWSLSQDKTIMPENEKIIVSEPPKRTVIKEADKAEPSSSKLKKDYKQISIAQLVNKQQTKKKVINKSENETVEVTKPEKLIPVTEEVKPKAFEPIKAVNRLSVSDKKANEPLFLSELSYDFRRSIPTIDINVFVYSNKPNERFIMIDMKKYQEGQEIETDMVLKEIRKNSIVVEYKNKVFQVKR